MIRSVQPQRLGRRAFLRGVFGGGATVAVGLPLLEIMVDGNGTALAGGAELPMRFGMFHWGNGILHEAWVPSQTGFDWEVPDSLRPFVDLAPELQGYLTLVTGTNHRESSPGHIPARGIALSSSHNTTWVEDDVASGYREQAMPEPTLDAIVRDEWRGRAALRDAVQIAVTQASPYHGNTSWNEGGRAYNVPETSPSALFDLLFSGFAGGAPPGADPRETGLLRLRTALGRSMLDAVMGDANRLRAKVGASDRVRLDDHLEAVRALERRLADYEGRLDQPGAAPLSCEANRPGGDGADMRDKSALMGELLALALACDLTRVFSYEWSANQSEFVYAELGIDGTHHDDISHNLAGRADDMRGIMRLVMGGLAHLADQLRRIPELDGNVLDRTLILATSEHANANSHDYRDHPLLLVGRAGGAIRAGQHFRHPSPDDNLAAPDVLLTAVRAVGVPREALGMAETTDSIGNWVPSRRTSSTVSEIEA